MLSRIDLRGSSAAQLTREKLAPVLPRAGLDVEAAIEKVRPICDDVRHRGAAAVRDYTLRFDGVDLASTRVPAAALAAALAALDPGLRAALEETIRRLRLVCRNQLPGD
ncbi:MAG TPA: histidinol dehydrogenase, partial [Streptosporangiaceae bacterium]